MFYYTYKITLLKGSLAGHYYYGQHRTNNLNDGYAGSGRVIKDYFKKYPKIEGITYVKSILQFYNDENELNLAEKDLIGDKYITDNLCINLKQGGTNIPSGGGKLGNKSRLGKHNSKEHNAKIGLSNSISLKGRHISEDVKHKISQSLIGIKRNPFSNEHKRKLSEKKKGMHWKKDPETGKRIYYK